MITLLSVVFIAASNLFTCLLVHLLIFQVPLSSSRSNLFTCLLVHLSIFKVPLSSSQATCSLVNSFTRQLNYILTNKGNEKNRIENVYIVNT